MLRKFLPRITNSLINCYQYTSHLMFLSYIHVPSYMHVNLNINEDKILTVSYSCGLETKYFINHTITSQKCIYVLVLVTGTKNTNKVLNWLTDYHDLISDVLPAFKTLLTKAFNISLVSGSTSIMSCWSM